VVVVPACVACGAVVVTAWPSHLLVDARRRRLEAYPVLQTVLR
jgi:hypothetical protein